METKHRIILSVGLAIVFIGILISAFLFISGDKEYTQEQFERLLPVVGEAIIDDIPDEITSIPLCEIIITKDISLCNNEALKHEGEELGDTGFCVNILEEVDFIEKSAANDCASINNVQYKNICLGLSNNCNTLLGFPKTLCQSMINGDLNACTQNEELIEQLMPTIGCEVPIVLYMELTGKESGCEIAGGMNSYLCKSIVANDCKYVNEDAFIDYAALILAAEKGKKSYCESVKDPILAKECLNLDVNTVRDDLSTSPI